MRIWLINRDWTKLEYSTPGSYCNPVLELIVYGRKRKYQATGETLKGKLVFHEQEDHKKQLPTLLPVD